MECERSARGVESRCGKEGLRVKMYEGIKHAFASDAVARGGAICTV
jgi:hypothetical protein